MIFETLFRRKKKTSPWHDLLTEWIEKMETGDLSALQIVYAAFASRDPGLIRRAGSALQTQLAPLTQTQLLRLCERFRTFTSLKWNIDWADIDLKQIKKELAEEAYRYVLILGSFHPNGYFRETCIREMADLKGTLFWLFPQVNDWVLPVRSAAFMLLETRLSDCDGDELIACLPAFERLQNCRRRTEKQIQILRERLETKLARILKTTKPGKILCLEPAIRASLYRTATQTGLFDFSEMEVYLELEKMTCLKRILIRKIFTHPDCGIVKCTLLALGSLEDFTDEALLWRYVLEERADLSKAAYLSICKRDFYPGAARIYNALLKLRAEHHRRYLLKLLLREPSWNRLPYLLLLYRPDLPAHEKERILSGIRIRSTYRKVSEPLRNQILQALEQKKDSLPSGTAESILHDMRVIR